MVAVAPVVVRERVDLEVHPGDQASGYWQLIAISIWRNRQFTPIAAETAGQEDPADLVEEEGWAAERTGFRFAEVLAEMAAEADAEERALGVRVDVHLRLCS